MTDTQTKKRDKNQQQQMQEEEMKIEDQIQQNSNPQQNKRVFSTSASCSFKEVMVGSISKLKQLEIGKSSMQASSDDKKDKQAPTPQQEFIQTYSFQNSIYIAYVNGNFIRITRQRFVKTLQNSQQSDYSEFVYSLNENICNQVFFMGVENANHESQLDNSVIIIIPCANGQIHVKQLIESNPLRQELNIEAHGQIVYSIGQVHQNHLKQRIEICACLANSKVFCYEIDVGSITDPNLNFIRHTSEIKLFDNFINKIYHQKIRQNQDYLIASFTPVSRFILIALTRDFKLKVINYKQKQVKCEVSLLTDKEMIAKLDPFKNVKINTLINNPLVKNEEVEELQNVIDVLICVSFVNNSVTNEIQLYNLEVIPQEELGKLSVDQDMQLSTGDGLNEKEFELKYPLAYTTNVKFGDFEKMYSQNNKSEIIDVSLSQQGLYIASVPTDNNSIQYLSYENIYKGSKTLQTSTVKSVDFQINYLLQQDLEYLESDNSNMAFKEYPLNRLFQPDRFPLKLIYEFYSRYTEFQLKGNFLGTADIQRISNQLLMQNEMKFEKAIKNSLISLTNNWVSKYPIVALHIDPKNRGMLPVVVRENGLYNLVPMSFYENLNFKLNEFVSEYNNSQKFQTTIVHRDQSNIPQNKYSQSFSNSDVYKKYDDWCKELTNPVSFTDRYLPQIFELLSWTKLFLMPDILNCLNMCPYEQSFVQAFQEGIQSASNTLSYESLSDQFEKILCNDKQKNNVMSSMKVLLDDVLFELFHENLEGNPPCGQKDMPLLINIDFCVWSKNLVNGSIRFKIRELVEISLTILSFFKYIEFRNITGDDMSYVENTQKIIGIAYSMIYLFDKPLLQLDKLNKQIMKDEEQSLDHILYMDVMSYFISSELTLLSNLARNDNLIKNKQWLEHNCHKVELSLFQNLSLKLTNNYLPSLLKFLLDNHQIDISICISQFLNQTPAIIYSQAQCLYQSAQYKKVVLLLHKIISLIHINPSILNDGPWTQEKHILAVYNDQNLIINQHVEYLNKVKDTSVKEEIKFIRHCLQYFFKETIEDLKCKNELAQMGLLLFSEDEEDIQISNVKTNVLYKMEFMRACFIFSLQISEHHQAFNYIKQMNELHKKTRAPKQILDECISKFVQDLCNNEMIGIISQLIYEDDLSEQIEKVINDENQALLQNIISTYENEKQQYLYLDKQLSKENLYKFNSSMNFYISIKNYKQAGLSQWNLYCTLSYIVQLNENEEQMAKILYVKLLKLQILALKQSQSLFQMAGYEKDIVIYQKYNCKNQNRNQSMYEDDYIDQEQSSIMYKNPQNSDQLYDWISVRMIEKIIVELEAKLAIEQSHNFDEALNLQDENQITAYLIQFKKFTELITYMHKRDNDFTDVLIYLTNKFYCNQQYLKYKTIKICLKYLPIKLIIFQMLYKQWQDNGFLQEEEEDIDYFSLLKRILIINQNQDYMKYSIIVLKTYGSCITDNTQVGEKMKGLAQKLNLPKMNIFLFHALSDFGEDRVNIIYIRSQLFTKFLLKQILAEEIANMAIREHQHVNQQEVNIKVHQKQYIPLQLISKVLDNNAVDKSHQHILMQVSQLFQNA